MQERSDEHDAGNRAEESDEELHRRARALMLAKKSQTEAKQRKE